MNDKENQGWSDAKCIEIAYKNNFPSIVKDTNVQKSITNNFVNFYLTGKVPKGHRIMDILFAAISIMPLCQAENIIDNFIWKEYHYSNDGTLFFINPEDRLRNDIKMVLEKNSDTKVLKDDIKQENETSRETQGDKKENLEQGTEITTETQVDKRENSPNLVEDVNCNEENLQNNDDEAKNLIFEVDKKTINWFRLKTDTKNSLREEIKYGPEENTKFCIFCNKVLGNWENQNLQGHLKFFFGVTALVLMRARVKSVNNLDKYFKTKFISLDINRDMIPYIPPHKSCIVKSWKALRNETPEMHTMFAKLVLNSFYINHYARDNQLKMYNIFRASVLAHTVNTGMGLIALLQRIALYCDVYETFECFQSEEIRDSWESVRRFLDKYMTNKKENTYHWARLIAPEQFQELSCKNNYKLAVILAVFVEKLTNSQEVWNAGWTKNKTYDLDSIKKLGYKIYDSNNPAVSLEKFNVPEILQIMFTSSMQTPFL